MSGLGGNLTYPANKQFRNSFGIITKVSGGSPPAVGAAGQEFRLIEDKKIQRGTAGAKTLFIESTGDYIPGGAGASFTRVNHADAVAKVMSVVLEDRAPSDSTNYEIGFTVLAKAQHPGVMNDNFYGQRRTYSHKFKYIDGFVSNKLSNADVMRAYADITNQITEDIGRYDGQLQGSVESVVDAQQTITFDASIASATFDIPAVGLYGKTLSEAAAYIDSPTVITGGVTVGNTVAGTNYLVIANSVAKSMYVGQVVTPAVVAPVTPAVITHIEEGATNSYVYLDTKWTTVAAATFSVSADAAVVTNRAIGITSPGYGFIVHPNSTQTISSHKMTLTTKDKFKDLTTFEIEHADGVLGTIAEGNYELLPYAEVLREFAHMGHDVPLSNHHVFEKPANTYNWVKFILQASHVVANMHGASHSEGYKEDFILYVPNNLATTGVAGCVADLEALLTLWATA